MHDLATLFAQLGLDNSEQAIEDFIAAVSPIPAQLPLHRAAFWNTSQAAFISDAINQDADWAIVVEKLDSRLR